MRPSALALPLLLACGCAAPHAPSPPLPSLPPTALRVASTPPAPTASASVATPVAPPDEESDAGAPKGCSSPAPKSGGVVPDALIPSEPTNPRGATLADATACVAALEPNGDPKVADRCWWSMPTLLGFDPSGRRVAALTLRELSGAARRCSDDAGEIFDLASWRVISRKPFKCGDDGPLALATARFADQIARAGFVPIKNLVTKRTVEYADSDGYVPVAMLDDPLCGSMIQVVKRGSRFVISFVGATNDWSEELGTMPIESQPCPRELIDHGRCVIATTFAYPVVAEVALTPDRKRLVVQIGAVTGGHNGPTRFQRATYALPAKAVLASP